MPRGFASRKHRGCATGNKTWWRAGRAHSGVRPVRQAAFLCRVTGDSAPETYGFGPGKTPQTRPFSISYLLCCAALPRYLLFRAAQPRYLLYRAAQPRYLLYRAAQPRYLLYRAAKPRYLLFRAAKPRYLLFCAAQPRYLTGSPRRAASPTGNSGRRSRCCRPRRMCTGRGGFGTRGG